jgi:MOSC domain-containing protein YiiM
MERPDFPKRFLRSGRTGFYLRVLEEGELGVGDEISLVSREPGAISVEKLVRKTFGV